MRLSIMIGCVCAGACACVRVSVCVSARVCGVTQHSRFSLKVGGLTHLEPHIRQCNAYALPYRGHGRCLVVRGVVIA